MKPNTKEPANTSALDISHGNVKETDKQQSGNKQILEYKKIPDTPFTAVRVDDVWYLLMGKRRLTAELPSLEACEEEAKDASWMRIIQVMMAVIDETLTEYEIKKK